MVRSRDGRLDKTMRIVKEMILNLFSNSCCPSFLHDVHDCHAQLPVR